MMRQVVILLSLTAFAVGKGTYFQSTKNMAPKSEPQQFASVASFHSTKNAPQATQYQAAPQVAQYHAAAQEAPAAPQPYAFSYEAEGSARQENGDASGKVTGFYTVRNEDGTERVVKYVADENGFRADVETNEAGTKSASPSNVDFKSSFVEPPAPQKYAEPQKFAAPQAVQYGAADHYEQQPIQFTMDGPSAYSFQYESQLEDGGRSAHQERADGSGQVSGQYSLSAADGRLRQVAYSSGAEGFRAQVETNEAGTKSDSPANAMFYSSAPQAAAPVFNSFSEQKQIMTTFSKPAAPKPIMAAQMATSPVTQQHIQAGSFATSPIKQQHVQEQYDSKPSPYSFSYDAQLADGSSSRSESADASGKVVGSYSLSAADGRQRTLHYQADHQGFRASVDTNEFGTDSDSPADVQFKSSAPKEAPAPIGRLSQKTTPAAFPVQQSRLSSGSQIKSAFASQSAASGHYQAQSAVQYNSAAQDQFIPYAFNYVADMDDGSSSRSESADASGKVVGSYSLSVDDGRKRTVDYLADDQGFRATVNTNEFGTKSDSPADIMFYSSAVQDEPQPVLAAAAPVSYKGAPQIHAAAFNQYAPAQAPLAVAHKASAKQFQSKPAPQYQAPFVAQLNVEPEPSYQPSPYAFNYEAEASGGSSSRSESADASGKVTGSYKVQNEDGSMRVVEYIADKDGFRANVKTNEPGTKSDSPADVILKSDAPAVPSAPAPFRQQQQNQQYHQSKADFQAPSAPAPFKQQQQNQQYHQSKANFPSRRFSQKTSMISQQHIAA